MQVKHATVFYFTIITVVRTIRIHISVYADTFHIPTHSLISYSELKIIIINAADFSISSNDCNSSNSNAFIP